MLHFSICFPSPQILTSFPKLRPSPDQALKCHADPQTWIHSLPPTQPSPAITSLNIVTFALSSQAFTHTLDFYRLSKMQICFETWFLTFFIGFHAYCLWVTPDQTCSVYREGEGKNKTGKVNASSRVRLLSCLPQKSLQGKVCIYLKKNYSCSPVSPQDKQGQNPIQTEYVIIKVTGSDTTVTENRFSGNENKAFTKVLVL